MVVVVVMEVENHGVPPLSLLLSVEPGDESLKKKKEKKKKRESSVPINFFFRKHISNPLTQTHFVLGVNSHSRYLRQMEG